MCLSNIGIKANIPDIGLEPAGVRLEHESPLVFKM